MTQFIDTPQITPVRDQFEVPETVPALMKEFDPSKVDQVQQELNLANKLESLVDSGGKFNTPDGSGIRVSKEQNGNYTLERISTLDPEGADSCLRTTVTVSPAGTPLTTWTDRLSDNGAEGNLFNQLMTPDQSAFTCTSTILEPSRELTIEARRGEVRLINDVLNRIPVEGGVDDSHSMESAQPFLIADYVPPSEPSAPSCEDGCYEGPVGGGVNYPRPYDGGGR